MASVLAWLLLGAGIGVPRLASARAFQGAAVIVGNNAATGTRLPTLRYADDDAVRYAELFEAAGIQTQLLVVADADTARRHAQVLRQAKAPTSANLERALQQTYAVLRQAEQRGLETAFYFVYSGHGDVEPGNAGRVFLHDRKLGRGELLRDVVGRSPATFNHVIVDACHSYFMVEPRGEAAQAAQAFDAILRSYLDRESLDAHPNTGVVVSTTSRAEVHESSALGGGLFSHLVRSALAGAADADSDGQVSYAEVGAFLAAANQGVVDAATTLQAYTRPPALSAQVPLFFSAGADARAYVQLRPELEGHTTLVDDRGVRYLDVNKAPGVALTVALVPRPAYAVRAGERSGALSPVAGATAEITWGGEAVAMLPRGDDGLPGLFATPFGPSFVRGYSAGATDLLAPAEPAPPDSAGMEAPRLAVMVLEGEGGLPHLVENRVMEVLAAKRYEVIDPAQLKAVRAGWSLSELQQGPLPAELSALDADLLLVGKVSAQSLGQVRRSGYVSATASVALRAVRLDTGQVLGSLDREATRLALGEALAAQRAAQDAASATGEQLLAELPGLLRRVPRVELVVRGEMSAEELTRLRAALEATAEIEQTALRFASPALTRLSLDAGDHGALELADAMGRDRELPLRVLQISRAAIVAQHAPLRGKRLGVRVEPTRAPGARLGWLERSFPDVLATELANSAYLEPRLGSDASEALLTVRSQIAPARAATLLRAEVVDRRGQRLAQVSRRAAPDRALEEAGALARQLGEALERELRRRADLLTAAGLERDALVAELSQKAAAAPLRIEALETAPLLSLYWDRYARDGLAQATLHNAGAVAVDQVLLSLQVPGLVAAPIEAAVGRLAAGEVRRVPVSAPIDRAKLDAVAQLRTAQVGLTLRYRVGEVWYQGRRGSTMVVAGPDAVDWSEPAGLAAGIDPADPAIAAIAAAASATPRSATCEAPALANVASAVQALRALGLRLEAAPAGIDPSSRFGRLRPLAEVLRRGQGNRQELAALLAALLEAQGVAAALAGGPADLVVLASAGVGVAEGPFQGLTGPGWVALRGELWLPLDPTRLDQGLAAAWRQGAAELRNAPRDPVVLAEAWQRFPPAQGAPASTPPPATPAALARLDLTEPCAAVADALQSARAQTLQAARDALRRKPRSEAARQHLAVLLAAGGDLEQAEKMLLGGGWVPKTGRLPEPDPAVLRSRADLLLALGQVQRAQDMYARALDAGAGSAALYANLGLARMLAGDVAAAREAWWECLRRGGARELRDLIARARQPAARPASAQKVTTLSAENLDQGLRDVLERSTAVAAPGDRQRSTPTPLSGEAPVASLVLWHGL